MKTFILFTILIASTLSHAGEILGISDGEYLGRGRLVSQTLLVPSVNFISSRTLKDGVVTVKSSVLVMNRPAITLSGRLKFVPRSETHIDIYNLDEAVNGRAPKAGAAVCDPRACTFTATINGGKFTLTETWVRDGDGFHVIDGSQSMLGIKGVYEASFVPVTK